ncbi:hypothetical protein [uncultured Pontibacter sp.]|uniref:hypothetical protein n=1 Tax=uncultured Pontibacter sp. TaxID=453356 RepID=UPI00260681D6|nr:hypothetical protein [uncultured Pontibacter sp.]
MIKYSYPFIIPHEEGGKLYVSSNRFIGAGTFSYGIDKEIIEQALLDECKQKWPDKIAPQIASGLVTSLTIGYSSSLPMINALGVPDHVTKQVQHVFYGGVEIMGPNVTYTWPNGRITQVKRVIKAYAFQDSNVLYVRHESVKSHSEINYMLSV